MSEAAFLEFLNSITRPGPGWRVVALRQSEDGLWIGQGIYDDLQDLPWDAPRPEYLYVERGKTRVDVVRALVDAFDRDIKWPLNHTNEELRTALRGDDAPEVKA